MEQLIYGCADEIAGRLAGGWGVLHRSTDLTESTVSALQPLVSVALPSTMPRFPSNAELATREPRWRVAIDPQAWLLARSIEAGVDHSGRPGNVVTHAAKVARTSQLRGGDWFFADGWVEPFGPRATATAVLPDNLTTPPGWTAVAAWLQQESRASQLDKLAAHTAAMLVEGATIVLRAESVTELARWSSALAWLLPTAREPGLRLGEDPASLRSELSNSGPQIVGVCFDAAALCTPHLYFDLTRPLVGGSSRLPIADLLDASDEMAARVFVLRDQLAEAIRHAHSSAEEEVDTLSNAWAAETGSVTLDQDDPEAIWDFTTLPPYEQTSPYPVPDDTALQKVLELGESLLTLSDRVDALEAGTGTGGSAQSVGDWPGRSPELDTWVDVILIGVFQENNTLSGWQEYPAVVFELVGLYAAYQEAVKPKATGWEKVGWLRDRESCMHRIRDWLQRHGSSTMTWATR